MGILFVQIGDEPDAKEALTALVHGDNGVRCGDRSVCFNFLMHILEHRRRGAIQRRFDLKRIAKNHS